MAASPGCRPCSAGAPVMRFAGLSVMISGAASGFGRLAARRLAAEGARLSLADIDAEGLSATRQSLDGAEAITCQIDVRAEEDHVRWMSETVTAFRTIDIALNNAGVCQPLSAITDTPQTEFDRMMAINARGVFLAMKHQLPVMVEARKGAILNTASAAGLVGAGHLAAYAAAKHAIIGLTRSAADEHARNNIRINAICPSFAITPLFDEIADQVADGRAETRQEAYDRMTGRIPMRRVATADEVVHAMLMLVDPANSFMTGQAVSIDGGLTAI